MSLQHLESFRVVLSPSVAYRYTLVSLFHSVSGEGAGPCILFRPPASSLRSNRSTVRYAGRRQHCAHVVFSVWGRHVELLGVALSSGLVCRRQEKTESLNILQGTRCRVGRLQNWDESNRILLFQVLNSPWVSQVGWVFAPCSLLLRTFWMVLEQLFKTP